MKSYIDVGPSPYDESPTPAGRDARRELQECSALRNQIRRILGPEPEGARLVAKYFYTGGGYRELVCEYEEGDVVAMAYALKCEEMCPAEWDLFARVELTAGLAPIEGDGAWKSKY